MSGGSTREHGIVCVSETSTLFRYRRNRIRNELMPYLRQHFNPRADEALARTAGLEMYFVGMFSVNCCQGAGNLFQACTWSEELVSLASD